MSLNHFNGWHLISQLNHKHVFTVKPIVLHCLYPCDVIPQMEETITMQIVFSMKIKIAVLGFTIT